ncbi:hypothetical protein BKA56DRAFT_625019 [Ilyonectria sp. MPI-CAGE-AT-0026]|nr:hypothetical protein BKA56DRAFT_625019 [Ilyonectria sp. MPI-CAGE-AT-0026]
MIAGLPLYLGPHLGPEYCPMPQGWSVHRRNGAIADQMNGRDMQSRTPLFEVIRDHFLALGISTTQVMYWGNFLIIVLEHGDIDIARLPWRVARIVCQHMYDDEMGSPRLPQPRQQTDPTPGNPDQTWNEGHISAHAGSPDIFRATTTGVLVRDTVGNEFMTVAAPGFPSECGTDITHALPKYGRKIGEVIHEVSHIGLGVFKLEPHEKFVNVTFESSQITEPIRLKQLVRPTSSRAETGLFWTRQTQAAFMAHSKRKLMNGS